MLLGPAELADAAVVGPAKALQGLEVQLTEALLDVPQRRNQPVALESRAFQMRLQVGGAEGRQAHQARLSRFSPLAIGAEVAKHLLDLGIAVARSAGLRRFLGCHSQARTARRGLSELQQFRQGVVLTEREVGWERFLAEGAAGGTWSSGSWNAPGVMPVSPDALQAEVVAARSGDRVLQSV